MHNVDLVIVMGTSMKVAPVSEVPNIIPRDVPQIYISRDVRPSKNSRSFSLEEVSSQLRDSLTCLLLFRIAGAPHQLRYQPAGRLRPRRRRAVPPRRLEAAPRRRSAHRRATRHSEPVRGPPERVLGHEEGSFVKEPGARLSSGGLSCGETPSIAVPSGKIFNVEVSSAGTGWCSGEADTRASCCTDRSRGADVRRGGCRSCCSIAHQRSFRSGHQGGAENELASRKCCIPGALLLLLLRFATAMMLDRSVSCFLFFSLHFWPAFHGRRGARVFCRLL